MLSPRACAGCRVDTSPLPEAMPPGRMLAQIKARRAARGRGILSLTPGTPAHAAAVAARTQTDAEREGLWPLTR